MKLIYTLSFVFFTAISTLGFANSAKLQTASKGTDTTPPAESGSKYLLFKKVSTPIQTFAVTEEGKERVIFKIRENVNGRIRIIKIDDNNN